MTSKQMGKLDAFRTDTEKAAAAAIMTAAQDADSSAVFKGLMNPTPPQSEPAIQAGAFLAKLNAELTRSFARINKGA